MFKKIPGNVQKDSEECSNRNVRKYSSECSKDSREYLKIFKETLLKISGNIRKNFGECLKVLHGKKNHFFGVPKSIVHVMKPVSFQLCRAHPDGVIWKN